MPKRKATAREIEVKLPVSDLPKLIPALRALGAKLSGRVFEQNTIFDTPESDFRRHGRLLRVRRESPAPNKQFRGGKRRAVLTSKAPIPESPRRPRKPLYKEKFERELAIVHPEVWGATLRSLGFRPAFRYEKYRTTFRFHGLSAEIDETPAGTFLELEGSPEGIDRVARALGFSGGDYSRKTYWDVNAAYRVSRGLPPGDMLFKK